MNVPRRCCRPGCPHFAVATLTFVYSDSTAVVGPLATVREPHSWDLCSGHANRITAPRGWELVRHARPLPTNPDEDDLVALADAVRERDRTSAGASFTGFGDPGGAAHATVPGPGVMAGAMSRTPPSSPPLGHLRVLPDLND